MFSPKWKTDAKHLVKGARKFMHYKRDLLGDDRIGEIESRRQDLIDAIKAGDRPQVEEAARQIRAVCENSLPHYSPPGWFEENVEVMFVAIVIALGLRAYYLQPFRIPTGSMQPTLNGITGTALPREDWPSLPQRLLEKALRGRSYVHVVNDRDRQLAIQANGQPAITNAQRLHFFSRALIFFSGEKPMWLPAPVNPCIQIGLKEAIQVASRHGGRLPEGTVLCEGYIDTGDLVLVNKFAYHFRKPNRGEVFVFDTIGIRGIDEHSGEQAKGSHYIKRLCGLPGDTLTIQSPNLLINGRIAQEPGIQRVIHAEGRYASNPRGYQLASRPRNAAGAPHQYLTQPGDSLALRANAPQGMREYAALGDNTANSLDSRYWGKVREYNLVGPALMTLWPITTGHWGLID